MSDGFEASADVFAYLQRTGSRATLGRRLDARLDQPQLRTILTNEAAPQYRQYPIEVAEDLAVALWRFEEASGSVAAEAIDGLDGVYSGGITYRAAGALAVVQATDVNYAVTLNGSSGQIIVPHDALIDFATGDNGSVEFWIKTTQVGFAHVLGKHNVARYAYAFVLQADGLLRFERYNGSTVAQAISAAPVNDGSWHYVAGTWDAGTQVLLQIDDDAAVTGLDGGGNTSNTSDLVIGNRGGSNWFAGSLDELAIYAYALTGPLRQRHYDVGMGVPV